MNLASILAEAVAADPEKVAFKLDDVELSYAGLDEACAFASRFSRAAARSACSDATCPIPFSTISTRSRRSIGPSRCPAAR